MLEIPQGVTSIFVLPALFLSAIMISEINQFPKKEPTDVQTRTALPHKRSQRMLTLSSRDIDPPLNRRGPGYHKQHRLFLSLTDTVEYIRRHDEALMEKQGNKT